MRDYINRDKLVYKCFTCNKVVLIKLILEINREEFDCNGQMVERIVKIVLKIILFNSCFLQHLFSKIDTHNHSQLLKWKYHSFLKIMILTFLLLAKHGLKVSLSSIFRIILLRAMIDQEGKAV